MLSAGFWPRATAIEPDDTVAVFERAAEVRYYDGQELLGSPGRLAGAVYLLGYCVELVLKTSYCKLVGIGPSDPVWSVINSIAGIAPSSVRHHRIGDLHRLVVAERINRGLSVGPVFEGELQRLALLASSHWKEELRYRSVQATQVEAEEVDEASTWFMTYRDDIWR